MATAREDVLAKAKHDRHYRRRQRRLIFCGLCLILLVELVWVAHADRLLINQIVVQGNQALLAPALRQVAEETLAGNYWSVWPRRNIWLYPRHGLETVLRSTFPSIDSLAIKRADENTLQITLTERRGAYLWCENESCLFLDENGFAFAPAPHFDGQAFWEIHTASTTPALRARPLPASTFLKLTALGQGLEQIWSASTLGSLRLTRLELGPEGEYRLMTSRGWPFLINLKQENEAVLATLVAALKALPVDSLEYLDLRFPDKVFYKSNTGV